MDYLQKQFLDVSESVAAAAVAAGRIPEQVKIIAVSKTFTQEDILTVYNAGQRRFGENRVQELDSKAQTLPKDIEWHLLGHLQQNKVARAVQIAAYIHSVDSIKLLERIDRLAGEYGTSPKILIEANLSGESTKFGATNAEEIINLVSAAVSMRHLECAGLMTMAPYQASESQLHHIFSSLCSLRDTIAGQLNVKLPELSMGMSGDFPIAIASGATFVRIGTAIFGKRTVGAIEN
jgi:pyridoxal phosphate enzyme (YggS family)